MDRTAHPDLHGGRTDRPPLLMGPSIPATLTRAWDFRELLEASVLSSDRISPTGHLQGALWVFLVFLEGALNQVDNSVAIPPVWNADMLLLNSVVVLEEPFWVLSLR